MFHLGGCQKQRRDGGQSMQCDVDWIGRHESPHVGSVISRPKIVQTRFLIPFFAGKLVSARTRNCHTSARDRRTRIYFSLAEGLLLTPYCLQAPGLIVISSSNLAPEMFMSVHPLPCRQLSVTVTFSSPTGRIHDWKQDVNGPSCKKSFLRRSILLGCPSSPMLSR